MTLSFVPLQNPMLVLTRRGNAADVVSHSLKSVAGSYINIRIVDFWLPLDEVLQELPSRLQYLKVGGGNQLNSLVNLTRFTYIKVLDLAWTELDDLSPLQHGKLHNLEELSLKGTNVRDISPLKWLDALRVLDISYCRSIISVYPIMQLNSLEKLIALHCGDGDSFRQMPGGRRLKEIYAYPICQRVGNPGIPCSLWP